MALPAVGENLGMMDINQATRNYQAAVDDLRRFLGHQDKPSTLTDEEMAAIEAATGLIPIEVALKRKRKRRRKRR